MAQVTKTATKIVISALNLTIIHKSQGKGLSGFRSTLPEPLRPANPSFREKAGKEGKGFSRATRETWSGTGIFPLLFLLPWLAVLTPFSADARPLITEESESLGPATFDASFSISKRYDDFNSPRTEYETVRIPFRTRIGIFKRMDIGFSLTHLAQTLNSGGIKLNGSRPGLFSPELKYSPTDSVGFLAVYHTRRSEQHDQDLPIARGDDIEFKTLVKLSDTWPSYLNIGYVSRGGYRTRFGVGGGTLFQIEPGNIFESSLSVEMPWKFGFSILTELAYYNVGKKKIGTADIAGSNGDAMDALVGLTWSIGGWNIGAGAAFGLLDESHTSFDLERGAGDMLFQFTLAYKLKARKPNT